MPKGSPLAATVTAANVNEVTQVFQVLDDLPPVGGKPGPKRRKPERLQGDRGYDSEAGAAGVCGGAGGSPRSWPHGIRRTAAGLGVFRWFVEADHRLAAFVRPVAAPPGSAHGDSRGVPPPGLCPDLFEVSSAHNLISSERS